MNLRTARAAVFTDVSIPLTQWGGPTFGSVEKTVAVQMRLRVENDRYLQRLSCLLRTSCDSPCLRTS